LLRTVVSVETTITSTLSGQSVTYSVSRTVVGT
jgi:hypothetical protein